MKAVLTLLLTGLLLSSVFSEERKGLHHKKKHHKIQRHHKHQVEHAKHVNKYTKRIGITVTFNLGNNRTIRGTINETATEKATVYYLFQGIRYAKPPVDDLRFEPPQPYEFKGHYDALYERDICIQDSFPLGGNIRGSEDCLYLNVYTPSNSSSSKLPVLFWIYGGTFVEGDGNYESAPPDYFIDQNLIFVTINYRLGVFGFMSTGDETVPGNMALKDQLLALKWVHNNIIYFGGDPNNVTIIGGSAGAVCMTYLIQSPLTKGLFQKAIAHSGNSLSPEGISRKSVQNFNILATKLGLTGSGYNNSEIVKRMKQINATRLLQTSVISMDIVLLEDAFNGLVYAPVIEPPNPTQLFSAKSFEQLDAGNFTTVPLIMGYDSAEGNGFSKFIGLLRYYILIRFGLMPSSLVPLDMHVNTTAEKDKVGREIKELYFGNGLIPFNNTALDKYVGHNVFIRPTVKYVELFSKWEKQIYLYRFSYSTNSSEGVSHGGEFPYFFYVSNLTPAQKVVSAKVVKLWSNFIKTGNPTPTNEFNVTWAASSQSNNYSYIDIGEKFVNSNQSTNPEKIYLNAWEGWYRNYGNRPFDTY